MDRLPVSIFLRTNPLVATAVVGGTRIGVQILMLAAVTWLFTVILGRVFCGWACPLGSIFDIWGWFARRFGAPIMGPSPSWFRLKYYLLAAILIFSIFGGVSPLMGLDPIVLLTRVAAAVFEPFGRTHSEISWAVGQPVGAYGRVFDVLTLVLFAVIMAATTRVSRIWCRTACPLGAYLGAWSMHASLRRKTDGCIQCQICAQECPTGAISFKDQRIYNESECIKCFTCSQECPVDANYFELTSPLPAHTPSQHPVDLDKRDFLKTAVIAGASIPALHLHAGESRSTKDLIRPPNSREEHDFLSSCIRCGECMKACPTGILKPADLTHGLRALWSPVMMASEGPCKPECNACSQACPTDAIMKYPLVQKYDYKAGTAVFDSAKCISFSDGKFCSECVRVCPTEAISFTKGWEPEGPKHPKLDLGARGSEKVAPSGQEPTRPFRISFDQCIGCGACEFVCNQIVLGEPAMKLTSYGRATASKLPKKTGKTE